MAIKFLANSIADPLAISRFQQEALTASSLNPPHIVTVFESGEIDGKQYLAELVDGGTLNEWVHQQTRTWKQIVDMLVGVADGLAVAHAAGILHRDIKPDNILVTKSGYAKLAEGRCRNVNELRPVGHEPVVLGPDAHRNVRSSPGVPSACTVISRTARRSPLIGSGTTRTSSSSTCRSRSLPRDRPEHRSRVSDGAGGSDGAGDV